MHIAITNIYEYCNGDFCSRHLEEGNTAIETLFFFFLIKVIVTTPHVAGSANPQFCSITNPRSLLKSVDITLYSKGKGLIEYILDAQFMTSRYMILLS